MKKALKSDENFTDIQPHVTPPIHSFSSSFSSGSDKKKHGAAITESVQHSIALPYPPRHPVEIEADVVSNADVEEEVVVENGGDWEEGLFKGCGNEDDVPERLSIQNDRQISIDRKRGLEKGGRRGEERRRWGEGERVEKYKTMNDKEHDQRENIGKQNVDIVVTGVAEETPKSAPLSTRKVKLYILSLTYNLLFII